MELKHVDRESPDIPVLEEINVEAIPENERVALTDMIDTGAEVTGIYEDGEPVGFLVTRSCRKICYLAFLAVRSDLRSRGIGGWAVRTLASLNPDRQTVVEYEAPGENSAEDGLRARRKAFYLRNGFHETGWGTFYDGTKFEIGCSEPDYDAEAFREFAEYMATIVSDHIPRPYRTDREERISRYERMLDRAELAARQMEEARRACDDVQEDLKELERYYTGPEWKEDFEADEAGLLPAGLKRGVLSEDGIDAVLERFRELNPRRVRPSAKALVIRDGRMLALKMRDPDGTFYIMPGGGQRAGELLPAAAEREVAEETGIRVRAGDAAFVIEGARGEPDHRVDVVFRCEYLGPCDAERQPDTNQVGAEWLEIGTLNTAPLYPSRLRRAIMNLYEGKEGPVYLGNENAGDPEITG